MAYKLRDSLNTYVPKYTDLSGMDDQQVYNLSVHPNTLSSDATNAAGELRRRSLYTSTPNTMKGGTLPKIPSTGDAKALVDTGYGTAVPGFASRAGIVNNAVASSPFTPPKFDVQNNTSAFARSLGQDLLGYAQPSPFDPQGQFVVTNSVADDNLRIRQNARRNDTLTSKAERIVGDVMRQFGLPRQQSANRGLQTAYASTPRNRFMNPELGTIGSPGGFNPEVLGEWASAGIFPDTQSFSPARVNDAAYSYRADPTLPDERLAEFATGLGYTGRGKRRRKASAVVYQ